MAALNVGHLLALMSFALCAALIAGASLEVMIAMLWGCGIVSLGLALWLLVRKLRRHNRS